MMLSIATCAACDETDAVQVALHGLAVEQLHDNDFIGLGVSVRLTDGDTTSAAAGWSDPDHDHAYDVDDTEQILGSVTKLYTAVVIMQLVEEGRVHLDDTVDDWIAFPGAGEITVRMLLSHTSGLADYLNLLTLEQLGQPWTPEELLEVALAAGPVGSPGLEKAIYSNTNFLVLGMIVEAETGASLEANVAARIAAPLGLRHTYDAGERDRAAALAGGWVETEAGWLDTSTLFDPSVGWAVGAMVSTNAELLRFTAALYDGELFASPDTLAMMRRFETEIDPAHQDPGEPPSWIGLAITRISGDGLTLEGHLGHIGGYNAGALLDAATGEIVVVTSNDDRAFAGPIALEIARYLRDR
jgi:CubicO group peptidase (beta-lactamase class C family)